MESEIYLGIFIKFNGDNYHYLLTFKQNLEPFSLVRIHHLSQSSYKDYLLQLTKVGKHFKAVNKNL